MQFYNVRFIIFKLQFHHSQIFDIAEHIKIGSDYKMFEHISDNITRMPLKYSVLKNILISGIHRYHCSIIEYNFQQAKLN